MALKDDYFTISQAAKEFKVTRQTVSRWLSEDDITGEKVGRETLIHKGEIERFRLDRRMTADVERLMESIADYIRRIYGYSESDEVDFFKFDRKKADCFFNARKQGKEYEIIKVTIDKPEQIAERTGESSIVVGMKFPILKISKRKSSAAEINRIAEKYVLKNREKREKERKKQKRSSA